MSIQYQVFWITRGSDGRPRWKAVVSGKVLDEEWPDKASALAAMHKARAAKADTEEKNDG